MYPQHTMITNPNRHGTQKERILQYLFDNRNRKVKCYEFTDNLRIMNHTARISELKQEWWNIINQCHRTVDWKSWRYQKHSDYELLTTLYQP